MRRKVTRPKQAASRASVDRYQLALVATERAVLEIIRAAWKVSAMVGRLRQQVERSERR